MLCVFHPMAVEPLIELEAWRKYAILGPCEPLNTLYSHRACFLSFLPAVVLWESTAAVGRSMATASTTSPLILSPARLLTRNWADEPLIR